MREVEDARLGFRELLLPWIPLTIVAACVLLSHVSAVQRCALPIYGFDGAEYIEHGTRGHVLTELQALPVVLRPVALPRLLRAADSAYPPLLHVVAAYWGSIFGDGVRAAVHLNLVFLVMLATAVAVGTRHLANVVGPRPASWWAASLAACTVLLSPAVFGAARRYYYDLPMTAWIAVAFAALCRTPSSTPALFVASAATTGALLTKWTAGFALVPLWLLAGILALREPSAPRRKRSLVRLAIAALAVAILCLPVLLNSAMFRTSPGDGADGLDPALATATQASSFDIALGQTGSLPGTEPGGAAQPTAIGQRLGFYGAGLVAAVLGPLVALALLAVISVGLPGWRPLLLALALCVPTLLMLVSPLVTITDERFILPIVPLMVAGSFAMWDRCPYRSPRLGVAGLLLVAGLVQLASWDGRLPLGPAWTGRSSLGCRGWSRLSDTLCSPERAYEELGVRACASAWSGGEVIVAETACQHMGIAWMLDRACPEVGYRTVPAEVAADRLTQSHLDSSGVGPLSIVVSPNIAEPTWPEPHLQVWLPEDCNSPEDQLGLYLFGGGQRGAAEGKSTH